MDDLADGHNVFVVESAQVFDLSQCRQWEPLIRHFVNYHLQFLESVILDFACQWVFILCLVHLPESPLANLLDFVEVT